MGEFKEEETYSLVNLGTGVGGAVLHLLLSVR